MSNFSANRVLLVAWAGADWDRVHPLLDSGRLPNLERLVNQGVVGRITTVQPHVAPLVWNSIATGVRPLRHGVLGYLRKRAKGLEPAGGWHRHDVPPFWEVCSAAGLHTHVVNWPTYPAEPITGTFVSEMFTRFGDGEDSDYRSLTRAISSSSESESRLASLRIDPRLINHEELLPFVPHAAKVEQDRDPSLAILASRIADAASAHAMATALLEDNWQVAAVCYDLLDRLSHSFMRFQPPRASVTSRSYELYSGVMDQAYQFCDQMLGRLIELAGPQTTILLFSDHGFRTGSQRPSTASTGRGDDTWLRPTGILSISGPTTHRDRWIWGGSLLDLCPTLYSLLGLPWQSLDGKPLKDAFTEEFTTETVPQDLPSHPESTAIDPPDESEFRVLGRHLIEEGYLQDAHFTSDESAVMAEDACDFNAAQNCMQAGQITTALELFERCLGRRPKVPRFSIAVASCHIGLGQPEKARPYVEQAMQNGIPEWYGALLLGQMLLTEGKLEESLEQFFRSVAQQPLQPGIHVQIGEVYLRMDRTDEARRAFRKELDCNEDSFQAHFGLGKIALAEEKYEEALERLLSSAALKEVNPEVHYCLAQTLQALDRPKDALRAVDRALRQNPTIEGAEKLRHSVLEHLS